MKLHWGSFSNFFYIVSKFFWIFDSDSSETVSSNSDCKTASCRASEYLNASIDPTVDPCDNFYEYACGRWNQNPFREKYSGSTIYDRFLRNTKENLEFLKQQSNQTEPKCVQSVRSLYAMCMNTGDIDQSGLKELKDALERVYLTTTPPISEDTNPEFDITATAIEMQRSLGIEMFYSLGFQQNPYDYTSSSITILRPNIFEPPLPSMPAPSIAEIQAATNKSDYSLTKRNYFQVALNLLCEGSASKYCKSQKPMTQNDFDKLENYLQNLMEIKRRPIFTKNYILVPYSLTELQNLTEQMASKMKANPIKKKNSINWTRDLEMAYSNTSGLGDNNFSILIEEGYMENIFKFIYNYSLADHELGMWWTVVDSLAEYSVEPLRKAKRNIIDSFIGHQTRAEWCVEVVSRIYGPVVSYRYNIQDSYKLTKYKVTSMVSDIQNAFIDSIKESTWMDETSQKEAMWKIFSLDAYTAFPDTSGAPAEITIGKELDTYYKNCPLSGTFLDSVLLRIMDDAFIKILHSSNEKNIDLRKRKKFFFFTPPLTANAIYAPLFNSLIIPAGMLGFPIYDNERLEALNYGSIGMIIGHEMAHALDASGRKLNYRGQLEDWWKPETIKKYGELEDCLIDSYKQFQVNSFTLSEDIADNVGFRQAYYAYKSYVRRNGPEKELENFEQLNHDQLFTLAYANLLCESNKANFATGGQYSAHSLRRARVNGVLANSAEFSQIWKCKAGTRMNRNETKCLIW